MRLIDDGDALQTERVAGARRLPPSLAAASNDGVLVLACAGRIVAYDVSEDGLAPRCSIACACPAPALLTVRDGRVACAARGEERYRININGTRAVFEHCVKHGAKHCIFVGRHTYYGAAPDSPMYHSEDEPPMGLANFPELADLVSADLYAGSALWRHPDLATTVLRMCYTLGPSGHGTLATFLRGALVPTILGFDPLFQFMHERDVVGAIVAALDKRLRGVFNVAGPQPVPLSVCVRETGRRSVPLPEFVFSRSLGRFGLPKLPRGALDHIKYGIVMDATPFREGTGFSHEVDEVQAMHEFRQAFPPPERA